MPIVFCTYWYHPWLSQRVLLLLIFPPWHSMNNWEGSCWQDVYTFLRHKIWILSQIHWSWVCGNFSHHCVWDRVITNGGKNSHSSTKKIPTAPVLLQWIWDKIQILGLILPPNSAQSSTPMKSSMHTLHAYIACIFWSELKKFAFFGQSWEILHFLVWVEILFVFGVRVGKMSDFKQSWKILPSRVGKIMITERKKSNLAIFFNFDFNF